MGRHLVIVHNADSGVVYSAVGAWRRLRSPARSSCPLCVLTRGVRGVNPRWQAYLDTLSEPVQSINRDRFRADHASSSWRNVDLPAILVQTGPTIERIVSAAELRKTKTVKELIEKVNAGLRAHPPT